VELRYHSDERRSEVLRGGVPGWTWAGLQPLLRDLDALYINLISGFELDLETAQLIRQHFKGPIYCDLHSLTMGIEPDGLRTWRQIPEVAAWCACFDELQVNEDEVAMLAADPLALAATALGGRRPDPLRDLREAWRRLFRGCRGGRPLRTALVPATAARVDGAGDPTGCGDVWGATYFSRFVAGDTLSSCDAQCLRRSGAERRTPGATGLAHHLRGDLHPL
jgi:hypothetical protein